MAVALLGRFLCVAVLVSSTSAQVSPVNVAVGKPASQSSTFDGTDGNLTFRASADLAVDGAPTKRYADKTCALNDWQRDGMCPTQFWWQVDLGVLYDIFNVTIFQRGEEANNFGPLVVRVGDHVERPENRTLYKNHSIVRVTLSPPVTASTVNISIAGCGIIQLCEVEVFAVRHVDECASKPCLHGGRCTDGFLNYTCLCVPGFTGVNCETDVDECASNPCQPGGNCTDAVAGYTCHCAPGYTGVYCETDVNECKSTPCQHGGNCADAVAGYICHCVPGYTGVNCETDVDECASEPCQHGGNCIDAVAGYTCHCAPGYTGVNCETDVDECVSKPCQHGGSCMDAVSGYTCHCLPGYTGVNCETVCSGGTFGLRCSQTCSPHCLESCDGGGQHCHYVTGQCLLQSCCKDGFQGPQCDTKQQACPAASADRYTEGVGTGLGVGLGASLLLALGTFAVMRCRRRHKPPAKRRAADDVQLSPRQMQSATRQQEVAPGQEGGFYESLGDASKDLGCYGPYAELGEARVGQETTSPYSQLSA